LAANIMGGFPKHFAVFEPFRKWLQDVPWFFTEQIAAYFLQSN
jgi:hypothetical protein